MQRRAGAKFAAAVFIFFVSGCAAIAPEKPQSAAVSWADIPGWAEDSHAEALPVFLRSCKKLSGAWRPACDATKNISADNDSVRRFFEKYFSPRKMLNKDGGGAGLITGYYEPLLHGAPSPSERFRHPVYAPPAGLLHVELGGLYPELKNKRVRGRAENGKVIPYYSRAEIDGKTAPLAGGELFWVDDKTALFFLHIQGSGLVQFPDGRIIGAGYADQNGHPYRSIGKILVERGEMKLAEVNLFSLRAWLKNNPKKSAALLNENPSYVFFIRRDEVEDGPFGSLGVPLTPERSLAADTSAVPPGAPVWLDTVMPDDNKTPLRKLMFAQDTGGAIRGNIRADFFLGRGALFVLLPR